MNRLPPSYRHRSILGKANALFRTPTSATPRHRILDSDQSTFSIPIRPLPPPSHPPPLALQSHQKPNSNSSDFACISSLLSNPAIHPGPALEEALTASRINSSPDLLLEVFNHFDSSPKPLLTLFQWAKKQPGNQFSRPVFNAMINSLGKGREFDSAWRLILDQIHGDASERPDFDTFAIMIRRHARSGNPFGAIRAFKYASTLDISCELSSEKNLFEILLDSLCKEGQVRVASEYLDKYKAENPSWSPSIRIYNMLLNGWFRLRKLKHAERLWEHMKKENVKPTVVSYGTLIEGLCRMRRPDMALHLVDEMKLEGVEPNAIVYNPIIDALGEDGRFKEALGMLERFSILESGPTISTYNSLVKGFCKAGDLMAACRILHMMLNKKCVPTSTTYNYFFRYFSKFGKLKDGLTLYTKMIELGYEPDRLTYHLLVKMLCKERNLDLARHIITDMRSKGCDLDLSASTMLIHLLCQMRHFDDAVAEFEDMIRRGIVPQYLTYQRMRSELHKRGMPDKAQKLHDLMSSVPHSTKLPDTRTRQRVSSRERNTCILQKAEAMAGMLKTSKDHRKLGKR
ncbi:pentatricopeptide repeat-containing protein mitochondrial [Dorcoceras hygrometricum]|uniref:Pentatricopeptide repeat-containing protein mitochondrial n=1 Tax=Dorcoceras hygrometricum TaxID=472368 RepID=A0A2Z7D2S3_9LAMI|nr:pentatricopeptide repeat-containing protein mitochondrial [Dorcoceras hygrometricum]